MDKLNKQITARLLRDVDSYRELRERWGYLNNSAAREKLGAADHLLYLVLRGQDWRKAFVTVTNPRKLAGGHLNGFGQGYVRALYSIQNGYKGEFADLMNADATAVLRELLPAVHVFGENVLPDSAYRTTTGDNL